MKDRYERLEEFIKKYKENPINTKQDMKNYYDDYDEYWFIIEELLDKIVEIEKTCQNQNNML